MIQGRYERAGTLYPIANERVVRDALESVAKDPAKLKKDPVFGNRGFLAGIADRCD